MPGAVAVTSPLVAGSVQVWFQSTGVVCLQPRATRYGPSVPLCQATFWRGTSTHREYWPSFTSWEVAVPAAPVPTPGSGEKSATSS